MKDVRELQDRLDHVGETIAQAQEAAQKLARAKAIDRPPIPRPRRGPDDELFRDF
ncbi:hypothetical protein [Kineosporia sp. NBRC 101731]|uniref:hypothetical protein n=1 Tax=Kineosporia sp. NBRC 101731 TaxID=3032199 RepID=UPI0024A47CB9|nr:hypothetical protein [Kineosporia sp. NBRC 101731]GLY30360.1 hypothetical protein Kisp02_37250 [Kineosporia sp. NBRC 101731]